MLQTVTANVWKVMPLSAIYRLQSWRSKRTQIEYYCWLITLANCWLILVIRWPTVKNFRHVLPLTIKQLAIKGLTAVQSLVTQNLYQTRSKVEHPVYPTIPQWFSQDATDGQTVCTTLETNSECLES